MKNLAVVLFLIAASWKLFSSDSVELGPGVKVNEAPTQTTLSGDDSFVFRDYKITRLAQLDIQAKVLSKANYILGRESDLSSVDLALGWQNMSDETVLNHIDISQSNRWYYWRAQEFPIPRREIETQSANMHVIAANSMIEDLIDSVKQGQIIELSGSLVRVDANDNWSWKSSLSRDDTGAHACEVLYVENITIIQ